jgi:hypothetical protein
MKGVCSVVAFCVVCQFFMKFFVDVMLLRHAAWPCTAFIGHARSDLFAPGSERRLPPTVPSLVGCRTHGLHRACPQRPFRARLERRLPPTVPSLVGGLHGLHRVCAIPPPTGGLPDAAARQCNAVAMRLRALPAGWDTFFQPALSLRRIPDFRPPPPPPFPVEFGCVFPPIVYDDMTCGGSGGPSRAYELRIALAWVVVWVTPNSPEDTPRCNSQGEEGGDLSTHPSRASQAQAAHTPCLVPDRPLGASSRSMLRVPSHFPHARRTTESTNLTSVPAEAGRHSCPPTAPAVYPLNGSPKPVQCVEVCSPLSVNRVLQQLCLILCTRIR